MTERAKPLRWKQVRPNCDRGWLLRRGDVVVGKVFPLHGKMTSRVLRWFWVAGESGEQDYGHGEHVDPSEAKRQCLAWVKAAESRRECPTPATVDPA
jgi:hypothetical protein